MIKILCFAALLAPTNAIVCTPTTCHTVRCAAVDTSSCTGVIVTNGGFCGCCDTCVRELAEGERCSVGNLLFGFTSTQGQCAGGLFCDGNTCRKLVSRRDLTPCATELAEVNARLSNDTNHMLLGLERPRCEDDGTYKPIQYGGSQAICVTANGTRLYDYMVFRWEAGEDVNCQCARDKYAYTQTGMRGKMFYCEKNGNYAPVGCSGSVCYCQDKMGKQVGTSTVGIWEKDSLNC